MNICWISSAFDAENPASVPQCWMGCWRQEFWVKEIRIASLLCQAKGDTAVSWLQNQMSQPRRILWGVLCSKGEDADKDLGVCRASTPSIWASADLFFFFFLIHIIALQYCVSFCPSMKWISHMHVYPLCQASLVAQLVKDPPAMQETPVLVLGWDAPLEKG